MKENNDNDLKFIKDFSKITISKICEEEKVDRANVLSGRASQENILKVKENLEEKINNLYKEKKENG